MEEIDIWRTANLLMEAKGAQALPDAIRRMIELLQQGNNEGAEVWGKVVMAVDALMTERERSLH